MRVPGEEPDAEPEPRFVLWSGALLYGAMAAVALGWLWGRDRLEALPAAAVGRHGAWLASAVGLAVGWALALVLVVVTRRVAQMRTYESMTRRLFLQVSETWAITFVLVGAIAEELLFRLAAQDAFGLVGSVALYVLLHMSLGAWWCLPVTLLHAVALGSIVQQGFGLLGSTTANAILNYLSLRRIQRP